MASSYTKLLREDIIRQWLDGKHRDTIAIENGLSTGTVSNMVNAWRAEIGSLTADEVWEFGVILRKSNITPSQCAKGFRLLNILHDLGFAEDDVEQFVIDTYKTCTNIGLKPDKIALHINELIGLTKKVPVDEISDHINRNRVRLEESNQELNKVTAQLYDAQANLDNAFSRYKTDKSETRWIYWLKKELADHGFEVDSISDLVNTIEDIQTLGFDAKKIVSKVSQVDDLENRIKALKIQILELQKEKDKENMRLEWLKEISGTHVQAISVFEQLAGIGIGLRELNILVNTIKETAYENGFSESTAVNRFMDDVTQHYKSVDGFKSRLEELKSEIEDTEAGLTVRRQSGSEMDHVTGELRKLWAMGVKSEDIVNLAKNLENKITNNDNNIDQDGMKIDSDTLASNLKKYRNLKTDIENLNKDKDELTREIDKTDR